MSPSTRNSRESWRGRSVIQIGLSFFDHIGNARPNCCTWQFNFNFSLWNDMYAEEPMARLANSGIEFKRHEDEGIDPYDFAQAITASGLVLSDEVHWLTYQGRHDFGFLLKVLTNQELPEDESEFNELMHLYFPSYCHVKTITDTFNIYLGTLEEVSAQFQFQQIGPGRLAGNNSLFTGAAFFRIREMFM
ncbi:hypothetical protein V5799_014787 [Amblyomma americanum]|uniref:Uncharacterized protein n=1 Tax=Amblyomma americanum TaxID=6943 RepID=A0AAQ4E207_AMBAM